jgi:hypothetical protein
MLGSSRLQKVALIGVLIGVLICALISTVIFIAIVRLFAQPVRSGWDYLTAESLAYLAHFFIH